MGDVIEFKAPDTEEKVARQGRPFERIVILRYNYGVNDEAQKN